MFNSVMFFVKDSELNELRKTIELLKKQNAVAQAAINGVINTPELVPKSDGTGTNKQYLESFVLQGLLEIRMKEWH